MSLAASPRFLRTVFLADAASCAGTALLQLAAAGTLAGLLGLPLQLLVASGLFLIPCTALAGWIALQQPLPRAAAWVMVAGNWAWVAGCVALLVEGVATTAWGRAYLGVQAVAVAVLAELQWMGLRRTAAGRPAAA
jgi:hypothetical protein